MIKNTEPLNGVLAFDPGEVTGIALLRANGEIFRTRALSPEATRAYSRLLGDYRRVVIEEGPKRSQNQTTRAIETFLRGLFPVATLVRPGQWKTHPAATCIEKLGTKHEKDAVRIGRWLIEMERDDAENNREDTVGSKKTST